MTLAQIPAHRLATAIAQANGFTMEQLASRRRHEPLVSVRHIAILLISDQLELSTTQMAPILGYTNHSSIVHMRRSARQRLDYDPEFSRRYRHTQQALASTAA